MMAMYLIHRGGGSDTWRGLVIGCSVFAALVIAVNPIGAHAIAKGAYRSGVRPERKMEMDDFRRDFDE